MMALQDSPVSSKDTSNEEEYDLVSEAASSCIKATQNVSRRLAEMIGWLHQSESVPIAEQSFKGLPNPKLCLARGHAMRHAEAQHIAEQKCGGDQLSLS
ncbi:hypothetical protein OPV22_009836 [Ensete ventricosum]|uniref:Uncharacterized protein n=1 Tax=Ensete ventricosum TaxID=4639 RepID=A0AAV8PTV2_ENSVE|nr:hypothetical protein OPV22_009836 [Ensete ventricosum]